MLSYIAVPDTAVPTTWPLTVRTVGAAALVDPHTKASRDFSSGDLWFLFPSPVAGTLLPFVFALLMEMEIVKWKFRNPHVNTRDLAERELTFCGERVVISQQ